MTNKELLQYTNICFCIRKYKEELKQLEIKTSGASAANITGMPRSGKVTNTVEAAMLKKETLEERIAKLNTAKDNIEAFIDSIDDPFIRLLAEFRYLKGQSWNTVAIKAGGNNTESGVRMVVKRYIDKKQEQG